MNVLEQTFRNEIPQFASFLNAYVNCSPEIQAIVVEMSKIIVSEDADTDDKMHAIDAFIEALWPSLATDAIERHQLMEQSDEFKNAGALLDQEEATFSEKVRNLMEAKGLTQEYLAQATGVTQPAIANILNRSCRPQQRTVSRFAAALGVEPSVLWPSG